MSAVKLAYEKPPYHMARRLTFSKILGILQTDFTVSKTTMEAISLNAIW